MIIALEIVKTVASSSAKLRYYLARIAGGVPGICLRLSPEAANLAYQSRGDNGRRYSLGKTTPLAGSHELPHSPRLCRM